MLECVADSKAVRGRPEVPARESRPPASRPSAIWRARATTCCGAPSASTANPCRRSPRGSTSGPSWRIGKRNRSARRRRSRTDIRDLAALDRHLTALADRAAARLRAHASRGRESDRENPPRGFQDLYAPAPAEAADAGHRRHRRGGAAALEGLAGGEPGCRAAIIGRGCRRSADIAAGGSVLRGAAQGIAARRDRRRHPRPLRIGLLTRASLLPRSRAGRGPLEPPRPAARELGIIRPPCTRAFSASSKSPSR